MSGSVYGWLTTLHGMLAALGLALLLHPIVTLRARSGVPRRTLLTAELAALLLSTPFVLGLVLYVQYLADVKPSLWLAYPGAVLRFETKEHLAAMTLGLVVSGALTLRLGGRTPEGREAAWSLLLCGWVLGLLTALLGGFVAGRAHPGF